MNKVPKKFRREWALEDVLGKERICMRANEGNCAGRVTKEHAMYFAGRQLQELWAILDICAYHHEVDEFQDGGGMDKEKHMWIALNRASDEELRAISKATDYIFIRKKLNEKYGVWSPIKIFNQAIIY